MTDLSIIIISWNTCDMLRACLASCMQHLRGVDAEIIVVDNDSHDGSADMVAEAFPTVRLVRNAENVGFGAANNQAMQIARGRHQLLLNPDTVVISDVFREALAYMHMHPAVGALGCRVLNSDRSTQMTCFRFPGQSYLALQAIGAHHLPWPGIVGWHRMRAWQRDSERDVQVITGCFLLARREAVEQVGLFDQQFFFYGEETDWCLRFAQHGWGVRFAPVGEIIHHGGASAMQLREGRLLAMTDAIVRLHAKHCGLASARIAWGLCLLFNITRLLGFSVCSLAALQRNAREAARSRAADCWRAIRSFATVWPRRALRDAALEVALGQRVDDAASDPQRDAA